MNITRDVIRCSEGDEIWNEERLGMQKKKRKPIKPSPLRKDNESLMT
jgi:hypothetical protein